jgi:P2 family phage contractile tail tube protein
MAKFDKDLLNGLNVSVQGVGHLGVTGKVEHPKLDMDVVDDISTGKLKAQYVTIPFEKFSSAVMAEYKNNNLKASDRRPLILKGNIRRDAVDVPIVLTMQGEIHELDDGSLEVGKEVGRKVKMRLDRYTKTVNGISEVVYDRINEVFIIDGKDLLAEYRQNVN